MKKKLWVFFACVMSLVFQLSAHQCHAEYGATEAMSVQEELQPQESSFWVSLQDLDFSEDSISIQVGERAYAVHSLEQQGSHWIVKVQGVFKCAWGHPLCSGPHGCGQCHTRICPLYQPRTSHCK